MNDIHTKQLLALILSSFLFTSVQAARPLRTLQQVTANEPLTQCLECVVGRESVLVPGRDAGYENATIVFSRQFHSFPVAITFPKDTSDVQGIVICARAAGVQAVPRSGGHSYEGTHSTSLSLQGGASLGVFGGMEFVKFEGSPGGLRYWCIDGYFESKRGPHECPFEKWTSSVWRHGFALCNQALGAQG